MLGMPVDGMCEMADEETGKGKVHLPSIFTSLDDDYALRRASLPQHNLSRTRPSYPPPNPAAPPPPRSNSGPYAPLSSYTFPPTNPQHHQHQLHHPSSTDAPPPSTDNDPGRPRLSTDSAMFGYDSPYSIPPLSSSASSFSFASSDFNRSFNPQDDWQSSPSNIVRPSSTPGQLSSSSPVVKYEDGVGGGGAPGAAMRHASFSSPLSQMSMFGASTRISGQDRRGSLAVPPKNDWDYPGHGHGHGGGGMNEYPPPHHPHHQPPHSAYPQPTLPPTHPSPTRSPSSLPVGAGGMGGEGPRPPPPPPRKRGKLPKETTDFLKAWLHRHADHPYPSEDEKKQLCHATGLSMSQVSNWMINARRRILAPAHRAASNGHSVGPTSSSANHTPLSAHPYARTTSTSSAYLLDQRRASMPAPSSDHHHHHLQLYQPMTLQSMPNTPNTLNGPSGGQGGDYVDLRHPLNGPGGVRNGAAELHRGSLPGSIALGSSYVMHPSYNTNHSHGGQHNVYPSGGNGNGAGGETPPSNSTDNLVAHPNTPPGPGASGFSTPQ